MAVSFLTRLEQAEGVNATGIEVPADAIEQLGGGRAPQVVATLAQVAHPDAPFTYRIRVAVRGGRYLMSFSSALRAQSGFVAGDALQATLELDAAPRTMEVPDDLAAALSAAGVADSFAALSYSRQRALVDPVTDAKTAETRQRRVEKAVDSLR